MSSICIGADVSVIRLLRKWRKFFIISEFDFLQKPSEDKRSKREFKLLFGFARPPTVQYNRWLECVIKAVAGGFPGSFILSRWKDAEEEGSFFTRMQRTAVQQHLAACLMLQIWAFIEPLLARCPQNPSWWLIGVFFRTYALCTDPQSLKSLQMIVTVNLENMFMWYLCLLKG